MSVHKESKLWIHPKLRRPNFSFSYSSNFIYFCIVEGVYVVIVHTAFFLFLYLTGVHFRGELQHGGDVSQQKSSVDQSELEK